MTNHEDVGAEELLQEACEVGEITVRGHVTMGCRRAPEQSMSSFADIGGFHTGDLGFCDAEGFLHFVGRASNTIGTGGINIAPAEIGEFFRTHPSVQEVAVVGVPDNRKGEVAVAFVTLREDAAAVGEAELTSYCRERVASFIIPVRMIISPTELPRTDTGKLARVRVKTLAKVALAGVGHQNAVST
jgi:acyl-CoA synthetase (AMP-forming)/AMP-acid ligase II